MLSVTQESFTIDIDIVDMHLVRLDYNPQFALCGKFSRICRILVASIHDITALLPSPKLYYLGM